MVRKGGREERREGGRERTSFASILGFEDLRISPCFPLFLPPSLAMPLLDMVRLDTMVTVVDSSVFLDAYTSKDTLMKRPELGLNELIEGEGGREEGVFSLDIETRLTAQREVADLLVEQVEYADVVILNKDGLLPSLSRSLLREVVQTLNPWAVVVPANYSRIPLEVGREGVGKGERGDMEGEKISGVV
jgi:G3E family GTPase